MNGTILKPISTCFFHLFIVLNRNCVPAQCSLHRAPQQRSSKGTKKVKYFQHENDTASEVTTFWKKSISHTFNALPFLHKRLNNSIINCVDDRKKEAWTKKNLFYFLFIKKSPTKSKGIKKKICKLYLLGSFMLANCVGVHTKI